MRAGILKQTREHDVSSRLRKKSITRLRKRRNRQTRETHRSVPCAEGIHEQMTNGELKSGLLISLIQFFSSTTAPFGLPVLPEVKISVWIRVCRCGASLSSAASSSEEGSRGRAGSRRPMSSLLRCSIRTYLLEGAWQRPVQWHRGQRLLPNRERKKRTLFRHPRSSINSEAQSFAALAEPR